MRGLKGKTAIVTGAGSGIGRAIALRLAAEGVTVGVFDINEAGAGETVKAIEAADGKAVAVAVACDITDYGAVTAAVKRFEETTGAGTDILVNNAGWDTPMPFLKTEEAFWKKVTAINWFGPLHMTHAVAQGMAARKSGRVVNIASDAGRVGSTHRRGRVLGLQGRDHRFREGAGARGGAQQRHREHRLPRPDRHAGHGCLRRHR